MVKGVGNCIQHQKNDLFRFFFHLQSLFIEQLIYKEAGKEKTNLLERRDFS